MKEVTVRDDPLGIKVYAVGEPSLDRMTEEEYDLFASSLELYLREFLEEKEG